jgi:hypothetical protein
VQNIASLQTVSHQLSRLEVVVHGEDESLLLILGQFIANLNELQTLKVHANWESTPTTHAYKATRKLQWLITLPRIVDLQLTNFCVCESHEEEWLDLFRNNRLLTVQFTCLSIISNALPELKKLRSLSLYLDSIYPCTRQCCSTRPSIGDIQNALRGYEHLEELELINGTRAMDGAMLSHLGKSLSSLVLCEDEKQGYEAGSPQLFTLTLELLSMFRTDFPLLRKLAIDVPSSDAMVGPAIP